MGEAFAPKRCSRCRAWLPTDRFGRDRNRRDGLTAWCKPCQSEHYFANRDARNAKQKEWYLANREQQLAYRRAKSYGLCTAEYDAMVTAADGRCAACGEADGRTMHVDHDHDTGIVRGLLCRECNIALGLLDERPERMLALAGYIAHHKESACL